MADFTIALPITLKFEGGWTDNPTDPGGPTNLGITFRTFKNFACNMLNVEPTIDNLHKLMPGQAAVIYRRVYWDQVRGDYIKHQWLANNVFDFYVNAGVNASILLQNCIKQVETTHSLIVDGSVGGNTVSALDGVDQLAVYRLYRQGRIDYYTRRADRFPQFIKGWLDRANAFSQL